MVDYNEADEVPSSGKEGSMETTWDNTHVDVRKWLKDVEVYIRSNTGYKGTTAQQAIEYNEFLRKRFCDIVPDLTSGSWEDIWETVRRLVREASNG